MDRKPLKIKDIMIAIVISAIIGIVAIIFQNYIKSESQKQSLLTKYTSALHSQVLVADKNIKYKNDKKISGNNLYIYFYADDLYTEQKYGDGYLKINFKTDVIDIQADTDKLKDILIKVKYYYK